MACIESWGAQAGISLEITNSLTLGRDSGILETLRGVAPGVCV
jgi:hypothetical protein